jgi:hypothetical protein
MFMDFLGFVIKIHKKNKKISYVVHSNLSTIINQQLCYDNSKTGFDSNIYGKSVDTKYLPIYNKNLNNE